MNRSLEGKQTVSRLTKPFDDKAFSGFAAPTSNTTYTPNQFFDVCLPHRSRGCVRIVAYLIRRTLGWSDSHGMPLVERHAISYSEFIDKAGVSRGAIKTALTEAIAFGFVQCVEAPAAKSSTSSGTSGRYELNWDEGANYLKNPKAFGGFFAGEGNRTYVPNQFFDDLVPTEALSVLKVVGSILRFSIGFQIRWGHRRQQIDLSYEDIRRYSHLADVHSLMNAINRSIENNYIVRLEAGVFDPNAGRGSKPAVYALKWLNQAVEPMIGTKTPTVNSQVDDRNKNPSGIGTKTTTDDRYKNPSDIEITRINNNKKQQAAIVSPEAAAGFELLRAEGFDERAAEAIASRFTVQRIVRQIDWLSRRNIKSNRLGLLRTAIEQDWPAPSAKSGQPDLRGEHSTGNRVPTGDFSSALRAVRSRFDINP
ncbi:MAG: hypothetical protein SGJ19_05295 [Planctomycetia bacterium]|nr:hypothetical protein [Planctomycetia bacterium]